MHAMKMTLREPLLSCELFRNVQFRQNIFRSFMFCPCWHNSCQEASGIDPCKRTSQKLEAHVDARLSQAFGI